jgi:hypothetical protein
MGLGDTLYRGAADWLRLVGNTTTTRKFLRQTGDGTSAAAPAWDTIVEGDIASALSNTTSAHNALSNAVSALSTSHTSLVNRVSANSATGGAGSVTSNELSNVYSAHNSLSNIVSNMISAGGGGVSVTSNEMSIADAAVSAQAASALSQAVSVLSQSLSVTNAATSNLTSAHNALSNVVSNMISAGAGGVSVTSNELSNAVSAVNLAHNALSDAVSVLTAAHNVLSNTVSALAPGGTERIVYAASDQIVSNTSIFADDSSLVFSATSAAAYRWEAWLMMVGTSSNTDYRFGFSVPVSATGWWGRESGSPGTSDSWDAAEPGNAPRNLQTISETISVGSNGGPPGATDRYPLIIKGVFFTSATAGPIRLKWAQNTPAATDSTRKAGSHIAYRRIDS